MKYGIFKDADDGRRLWWTPSGWTAKGVSFDSADRARRQAEALRSQGNQCVSDEAPEDWPVFEGHLLARRRRKPAPDTHLVNTVAIQQDVPKAAKRMTDGEMRRAADDAWIKHAKSDGYVISASLACSNDPEDPKIRRLLTEHIRAGGEKCLLRPQLWAAYAEIHAEAREGMSPRYLPYELHDDSVEESYQKDLQHASGEPRMIPRPEDWGFARMPGFGGMLLGILWSMSFGLVWPLLKGLLFWDVIGPRLNRWWWRVTTRNTRRRMREEEREGADGEL